jgi:L-asparaginase II
MYAPPLLVVSTRSGHVESEHSVHAVVVDDAGAVVARAGDPGRQAWWRSAAKLIQANACVDDGAADAFGFDTRALALACASHSGEDTHLEVAAAMLRACGCDESCLACGPHASLSPSVARSHIRGDVVLGPSHNNCSGKHAAMIALARHRGWALAGYEHPEHPVQQRLLDEVCAFSGLDRSQIGIGVDNCRAVTFRLSLTGMATAWARAGTSPSPSVRRLREAMWKHPKLVAGSGRSCTAFLSAAPGRLLVKVGAEGVYCAALPERGLGIALKVDSGDGRAAQVALTEILRQVDDEGQPLPHEAWAQLAPLPVKDTRGDEVGVIEGRGRLTF